MNTAGWLLTENGRQPWVVQGLLLTRNGNSPSVSLTEVALSLGTFCRPVRRARHRLGRFLMLRFAKRALEPGPDDVRQRRRPGSSAPTPALTY